MIPAPFSRHNPGHIVRVEQDGLEVRLIFSTNSNKEADTLAEIIVSRLQRGSLSFCVTESHETVM